MDLTKLEKQILHDNKSISFDQAIKLTEIKSEQVLELTSLARKVTVKYKGDGVFLRSIISAKT